ncbi:hypothetical protein PG999_000854 [Apiospora kogelbergensis]|uniref:Ankyrin repeat protein n=1 Tax=Apiospora kogelbergensis TaxID=1337665 RepID=A0AAW0RD44_9PEZI
MALYNYNNISNLGAYAASLLAVFWYIIVFIIVLKFIQFVAIALSPRYINRSTRPVFTNRRGGSSMAHSRPFPFPFRGEEELKSTGQPVAPSTSETNNSPIEYEASPTDIFTVKKLLMAAGSLPLELADMIVDQAEYWPCSTVAVDYSNVPRRLLGIRGGHNDQDKFLLRTEPVGLSSWTPPNHDAWRSTQSVPRKLQAEFGSDAFQEFVEEPSPVSKGLVRKIVFNIRSCDQGWGGGPNDHGTYRGSWTWFDAGLERFDSEAKPDEGCPWHSTDEDKEHNNRISSCAVRPVWPTVASATGNEGNEEGNEEDAAAPPQYIHDLFPSDEHKIQANKVATAGMLQHQVVWRWNDDIDPNSSDAEDLEKNGRGKATGNGNFVRSIKLGDIITVWGRSRFPGWENRVEKVEVKVYWAV